MTDGDWKEQIIKERLGGKKDWTDAERIQLSHQLDQEIEDKFDEMVMKTKSGESNGGPAGMKDRWTENNWEEKMAEHPIFAPLFHEGKDGEVIAPDNALTEGLAQLKFDPDHNSPYELAKNYKEEGIHYFKLRKYKLANISFTEGLKVGCTENLLLAQLLNNRAAASFHLLNFRSAIRDCEKAITLVPSYRKVIQRAAECCDKLGNWDELIRWTEKGLILDPTDKFFINLRKDAVKEKNKSERITRKKQMEERQKLNAAKKLLQEIKAHGVTLEETEKKSGSSATTNEDSDNDDLTKIEREMAALPNLEPCHPSAYAGKVHLNKAGDLVWPVVLVYPEYQQTDFIQHFNEKHTFSDQMEVVFGEGSSPAPWDRQRQYTLGKISIHYEDEKHNAMVSVRMSDTLKDVIASKRYVVKQGTPSFIITVSGSKFQSSYMSKYKIVKGK